MIDMNASVLQRYGMFGADIETVVTADTFLLIPQDLNFCQLAFRIGTPGTAQRAAFEKDNGTDTRSVIDTEFLDVEDHSFYTSVCFHISFPHRNHNMSVTK